MSGGDVRHRQLTARLLPLAAAGTLRSQVKLAMETHAFHAQLLGKDAASACAQATAAVTSRGHTRPRVPVSCRDPMGKRRSSRVCMQRIQELHTPGDRSRQRVAWRVATVNAQSWEAPMRSGVCGAGSPHPTLSGCCVNSCERSRPTTATTSGNSCITP